MIITAMPAVLRDNEPSYPTSQDNGAATYQKPIDQKSTIVKATEISAPSSEADVEHTTSTSLSTADGLYPGVKGSQSTTTKQQEQNSLSDNDKTAVSILKVIESYGVNYEKTGEEWKGLSSFTPTVVEQVKNNKAIRMILPAFPFKSPNARDKVLGVLPDLGEELALYHLNGLCKNIEQVYGPGAEVYISSDGLVYNGRPPHLSSQNWTKRKY